VRPPLQRTVVARLIAPVAAARVVAVVLMSSPAARDGCRARIFHVNDVYVLDNLPALRACVREESSGIPRRNVMVDLAGDFLGPSLLSSLDHGASMIDVLNRVPVNVVCFGNHEADVPYAAMRRRCDEFKGTWLNSNMPSFEHPNVVAHAEWKLDGNPNRSVALIGLNVGGGVDASLYREGAIGGHAAKIVPVMDAVDAAVAAARAAFPDADCVVPLTHQARAPHTGPHTTASAW
jgi:2',3'-cyclic-nucleotide 2'-phosphodiesterase (5'-nucleotidase family)